MEDKKSESEILVGPTSVLNAEAQKEVITHAFKEGRKNFMILFPLMMLTIFGTVGLVLYFVGVLKF